MSEVQTVPRHVCPKCGHRRTRVVGHPEQASLRVRCDGCGQVSLMRTSRNVRLFRVTTSTDFGQRQ